MMAIDIILNVPTVVDFDIKVTSEGSIMEQALHLISGIILLAENQKGINAV